MCDLLIIFKMEDLPTETRIDLLIKMGTLINYQYASNITDPTVSSLVKILREG